MLRKLDWIIGGLAFALGVAAIVAPLYLSPPDRGGPACGIGPFGAPIYDC